MANRYRILAVDDEAEALDVLKRVLEDNYEVVTAQSGEAAVQLLKAQDFDLLITDQRMPHMSGIGLIEHAKRLRPSMVRIMLTGYTDPKDLVDAINRGEVYRYITKPWDINDLLFTIRNGLETYQLRKDKESLLADLQMRLNAMTLLLDMSQDSVAARSTEDVVGSLLKYLPSIVAFDVCASLIEHEPTGRALLEIHCRAPAQETELREIRQEVLQTFSDVTRRVILEEHLKFRVSGDPSRPEKAEGYRSHCHVLLHSEGETVGVIKLFARQEGAFREDTRELLDILANRTAETIRKLRVHLSAERQKLELMVQSLADGVIMVDERNQVFVINPAARRLLRLSPDTPVDTRYLKDTLGFYPFDLVRGWQVRDGTIVREEVRVFDQVLHSIVSPVILDDHLLGVAVVLRDITEEKLLEDRKEEFVSIVSHELRSPLTSISGALDLLLHRFVGEVNEKQERYLQLAKGSCDKLNLIIDELLDLSRFEKGKMRMEMRQVLVHDLVREAVDNFQAAAQEKQVRLEAEVPAQVASVRGDRNRLHQVLNNLLSNALKFTPQGGRVKVDVFRTDAVHGFLGVSVLNNGDEIAEQDHERIFDKFEQARRSSIGAVAGSGLGLSISKSIIEAHGGRIWVESGRGQGTRFVFTLPEAKDQDAGAAVEEVSLGGPVKGRFKSPPRILVVDDDPSTTFVFKGLLMAHEYSVLVAHDGRDALRLARARHPDLIVMDVRMPQLDGLQVTDILHHDPETREIPVLVVSVVASEEEAMRAGAVAYLPKPVDGERLIRSVQGVLEGRGLSRRLFRVLIVDDDPAVRAICRESLESQGFAVLESDSGRGALDVLAKQTVDVVLLDVMLPDFDGFQVTEKIREERTTAHLPIIFISARGKTSDKVRALKLGGDDYMVKPFDALELGARVESVIKRKEREFDSSPTTRLPGSVALERELSRRLASRQPFTLCYLDLDNLKAFNDYYGYAKADGVIQQTGDLIRNAVEKLGTTSDFVAHIAGDDFVVVTEPERLKAIAHEVITNFDRVIPLYYQEQDQARGYIETEDRFGQMRRFEIMSISLAAVQVEPGGFRSHAEISQRAAELKKRAKSIRGSVLVLGGPAGEPQVI